MNLAQVIIGGGLVGFLLGLAALGAIAWIILTYIPMPQPIRGIIIAILGIVAVLAVCRFFGITIL